MGRIRAILTSPKVAFLIRFMLDQCLPPVLRERRWFYIPIMKCYNSKLDPDFKLKAPLMSKAEYTRAYAALVPMRETDLTRNMNAFVLANLLGDDVLEVGCGNGEVSLACAERAHKVIATDLVDGNLAQVRRAAQARRLEIDTRVADVERLPFEDDSFDTTLCLHTLEHVVDLPAAVSELKRVTKQRLLIVVPKERYYRYTCNYHVHFFGGAEQLILTLGIRAASCRTIDGALCYVGDLTRGAGCEPVR